MYPGIVANLLFLPAIILDPDPTLDGALKRAGFGKKSKLSSKGILWSRKSSWKKNNNNDNSNCYDYTLLRI